MSDKKPVFGNGVLKSSAREFQVFVDEEGNTWICDKDEAAKIDPNKPFANLYNEAKKAGLIACICRACAASTKSLESAKEQGLPICDEMSGHPSIAKYLDKAYQVIVF